MAWQQFDRVDIHACVSWHMLIALSIRCRLVAVVHVVRLRLRVKIWSVEYITRLPRSGCAVLLRRSRFHIMSLSVWIMPLDVVSQRSVSALLGCCESRLALNALTYLMHYP